MFDICIVGAGPSGSTLARLLGENTCQKVAIIERRQFNQLTSFYTKTCGGLLSEDAQSEMGALNLSLPLNILDDKQFFQVETLDFDNNLKKRYNKHYLNMDREAFDRYLWSLIPQQVTRLSGTTVSSAQPYNGVWHIAMKGHSDVLKAKELVVASGAHPFTQSLTEKSPPYLAVQKWYKTDCLSNRYTAIFDKSVTDYYSYTIPKSGGLIVGSLMPTGTPIHRQFDMLVSALHQHVGVDLGTPFKTEGCFLYRPRTRGDFNWIFNKGDGSGTPSRGYCIGEAAGAISPTSSEGFSFAFQTANALYYSLTEGADYAEFGRKTALKLSIKRLKAPFMFQKNMRRLALSTAIPAL